MIKVLGINSDTTTCDCCGKKNLKRVVTLLMEDGRVLNYGTDCAAKALLANGVKTSKSGLELEYQVIAYAQKWIVNRSAESIAHAIWDRYGFRSEAKDGAVHIKMTNLVIVTKEEVS